MQGRAAQFLAAITAIAAIGMVLRVLGARGDLWLDEIWTFALLDPLSSIDQIFWRVSHDNNHFLNSVYLYLVGPGAPPLLQRGLSIALGVGTVIAAGLVAASRGRRTAIVTSLLFALSYPMVHYGSEARGYAGLVLFTLLSIVSLERRLDNRGSGIALGAVILLGFLSHLTMVEMVVVLVAWTAWLGWPEIKSLRSLNAEVGRIFTPAFLIVLPLAVCVVAGTVLFGFRVGGASPFSLQAFAQGYGGMIRYLIGLPSWMGDWSCIVGACCLVSASAYVWRDRRSGLYLIGIVGLPLLMAALHLPNLEFPRYFLISGTLLLLWIGEMLGRGVQAGGRGLLLSAVALVAILGGNASSLLRFYEEGRGSYSRIVNLLAGSGDPSYAASHDLRTGMVVDYFADRMGRRVRLVPEERMCADLPKWLILEGVLHDKVQNIRPSAGCVLAFELVENSPVWGLSGIGWTLYRR